MYDTCLPCFIVIYLTQPEVTIAAFQNDRGHQRLSEVMQVTTTTIVTSIHNFTYPIACISALHCGHIALSRLPRLSHRRSTRRYCCSPWPRRLIRRLRPPSFSTLGHRPCTLVLAPRDALHPHPSIVRWACQHQLWRSRVHTGRSAGDTTWRTRYLRYPSIPARYKTRPNLFQATKSHKRPAARLTTTMHRRKNSYCHQTTTCMSRFCPSTHAGTDT